MLEEVSKAEIIEWVQSPVADLYKHRIQTRVDRLLAILASSQPLGAVENTQEALLTYKNQCVGLTAALELILDLPTQEDEEDAV